MNTRTTGTPSTTQRRPAGDARVDRLAGDVRLAIGSRIEAMRAHKPDAKRPVPKPLVPKRLTDGLRRNLP